MKVENYKSKSLVSYLTNEQIKRSAATIQFISFEGIIELFATRYDLKAKPEGYRVTEQGLEIITF